MLNLIKYYINKLNIDDINNYAQKNNVILNNQELNFIYEFIKTNGLYTLSNINNFNFNKYKDHFTEENYIKINKLINDNISKYIKYLK